MDSELIKEKLCDIIDAALERHIIYSDNLRLEDIDGWNSLVLTVVISDIEKEFKIKFKLIDYNSWSNFGELTDVIQKKLI